MPPLSDIVHAQFLVRQLHLQAKLVATTFDEYGDSPGGVGKETWLRKELEVLSQIVKEMDRE